MADKFPTGTEADEHPIWQDSLTRARGHSERMSGMSAATKRSIEELVAAVDLLGSLVEAMYERLRRLEDEWE